jgi:type III pantothenate kinase
MTPDVVVDVGNTRVKWGLVAYRSIVAMESLPEDEAAWDAAVAGWPLPRPATWVVASVRPARSERLAAWLLSRGDRVVRLETAAQLPLRVALERPDLAGIDRLLNAVAAKRHLESGRGAVLIAAGSAVVADWIDEDHVFQGGAIFPGLDLMAMALNQHTALLPLVQVTEPVPLPGTNTLDAMRAGILLAVAGGIREAVRVYSRLANRPRVFLTGGQAPLLMKAMGEIQADLVHWPEQTLAGILDAAGATP